MTENFILGRNNKLEHELKALADYINIHIVYYNHIKVNVLSDIIRKAKLFIFRHKKAAIFTF